MISTRYPKGNISIMVIFILLASGIIAVLTMNFVKQMVYYNGTVSSYYRSYYLARAGLETALSQINNRGLGFQYNIYSGDNIIKDNFECAKDDICGFYTTMIGKTPILNLNFWVDTGCNINNSIKLYSGQALVLPLFKDSYIDNKANVFTGIKYRSIFFSNNPIIKFDFTTGNDLYTGLLGLVTSGFTTISKEYNGINEDTIRNFLDNFNQKFKDKINKRVKNYNSYLIISNTSTEGEHLDFCIQVQGNITGKKYYIASPTAFIKSVGFFAQKYIGLEAIYTHDTLPGFLSHGYMGY